MGMRMRMRLWRPMSCWVCCTLLNEKLITCQPRCYKNQPLQRCIFGTPVLPAALQHVEATYAVKSATSIDSGALALISTAAPIPGHSQMTSDRCLSRKHILKPHIRVDLLHRMAAGSNAVGGGPRGAAVLLFGCPAPRTARALSSAGSLGSDAELGVALLVVDCSCSLSNLICHHLLDRVRADTACQTIETEWHDTE